MWTAEKKADEITKDSGWTKEIVQKVCSKNPLSLYDYEAI